MAFKKVSGERKYFKYPECSKGDVLVSEGVFLGTEEGKFGVQHLFKGKDGTTTVLNSAGHLNWLVDEYLVSGTKCNVIYAGKNMLTRGAMKGKEAHRFELEVEEKEIAKDSFEKSAEATPTPAAPVSPEENFKL